MSHVRLPVTLSNASPVRALHIFDPASAGRWGRGTIRFQERPGERHLASIGGRFGSQRYREKACSGKGGADPQGGPFTRRETAVSRRHPWRERGTSDIRSAPLPWAPWACRSAIRGRNRGIPDAVTVGWDPMQKRNRPDDRPGGRQRGGPPSGALLVGSQMDAVGGRVEPERVGGSLVAPGQAHIIGRGVEPEGVGIGRGNGDGGVGGRDNEMGTGTGTGTGKDNEVNSSA